MKVVTRRQIRVSGKGSSRQHAFAAALGQVQTTLLREGEQVLLRVEPLEVDVVEARERVWTERFLFLFLPREKREYSVTLDITVSMTSLDTSAVTFSRT
ncbi:MULTISPECIES: DUF4312 family protein [Aeromonas]|uniref:DUF4312 family protein n=1 Tax=Aeromonas schubertii TaxID=652 RepID=A0ABS7V8L8_9GAMM|nr:MULTISPECIES: DUF4312 family protein [Aeromonas]KUE79567.1 cytoplasmic protein [Aeromonas schubertii]MBZ6065407.1 DUF4312 family protein [Aeromonas schubertii]MBZ6072335.1 DUF4312 family protein [Aeromonas schubertii]QCG49237.1 DUF4312 family protein [Aeromonas schubertii]TNI62837.1 cytoplasmic protein [Aeromonas salmonicida]